MTHEDHLIHLIHHLTRSIEIMALDLAALNQAVADNTAAVSAAVVALHDPSQQAAVDAAAVAIKANTDALNAADAPPVA